MTVKAAATEVLKKAQTPLHAKDIAERIIAAGLWVSDGKTPEATVSASLYSEIKKNGDRSAFVKIAPQTFGLRDSVAVNGPTNVGDTHDYLYLRPKAENRFLIIKNEVRCNKYTQS
ncbi:hypothetical protein FP507_07720 [Chlorobium phaeovibrioides]|uniref:HTH HARE-type domain-containing protein n=1 Tax=Chlorobium phaeovibrioides TaxID=1094 RepID=A0A5M8ID60_CHLPH|nr:winged helix-turn-helix domain-containing protein [Chlorobium phaeovibrioides]KAA6232947.1 hypothetical protein FP507_07720 [Chlorobium phaeovibrioides]